MADSHANKECLRNSKEADQRGREAEIPKKCRARLDPQKAYHEKRKASEIEDQRVGRLEQKRSCQQKTLHVF